MTTHQGWHDSTLVLFLALSTFLVGEVMVVSALFLFDWQRSVLDHVVNSFTVDCLTETQTCFYVSRLLGFHLVDGVQNDVSHRPLVEVFRSTGSW